MGLPLILEHHPREVMPGAEGSGGTKVDALPTSVRGTEIKLHELEQKTNLWEGRMERKREEPQTISTLQALTESLMRDNIQLRRTGNLGNACIYSSKLLVAPPYSPPQL